MSIRDAFYAVAGPVNEIPILLTIILFWKDGVSLRVYFAISLLMYTAIVALTLAYFIPRDLILFAGRSQIILIR